MVSSHGHSGERLHSAWSPGLVSGVVAGVLATAPMTAVMVALNRRLPPNRAVPPGEITGRVAARAHVREHLSDEQMKELSLFAHFAYGGAAGAVLGPAQHLIVLPGWLVGMFYGLFVWAASYIGFLPALHLTRPVQNEPPSRHVMMIVAHLVWGAVLGAIIAMLRPTPRRTPG